MTCQYLRHSCTFLVQVICHNNSTGPLQSPRCRPGAALRITHLQISHFHKLPSYTDVRSSQPTQRSRPSWTLVLKTSERPSGSSSSGSSSSLYRTHTSGWGPLYTSRASYKRAGARSDLFLAWSHSLSTVLYTPSERPLFSFQRGATHSWKQNASLSSKQAD